MKFSFTRFNPQNAAELEAMSLWEQDLSIAHLRFPRFTKAPLAPRTKEKIKLDAQNSRNISVYIIRANDKIIGECSLQINPPMLLKKDNSSAWVGLTIGDKNHWGSGAAAAALTYLEGLCREMNIKRVELGVFEMNLRGIRFYQKMGYNEFSRIDDFTFYDGRFWQDLRLEKYL